MKKPGGRSAGAGPTNFLKLTKSRRANFPLIAFPKAWTPGTNGPSRPERLSRRLKKKRICVLSRKTARTIRADRAACAWSEPQFEAPAHRFTDQELAELAQPLPPQPPPDKAALDRLRKQQEFNAKLLKFLTDEGARRWLEPAPHDGGTITVTERRIARSERRLRSCRGSPLTSNITGGFFDRLKKIFP